MLVFFKVIKLHPGKFTEDKGSSYNLKCFVVLLSGNSFSPCYSSEVKMILAGMQL